MIRFQDPATLAATRAHVGSLRWRLGIAALFALGAALVLDSASIGFSWFLAIAVATGFDALLGRSYLDARGEADRRVAGGLFVWGCAFSVIVSSAMTLHVAGLGGGPGRVLGVLMAASAFVSAMIFLFQARGFMVVSAAPAAVCLLIIPFLPLVPSPAAILQAEIGAGCGVAGFLAYVLRAALLNTKRVESLKAATREARAKHAEAEAKRAEAEEANRAKSEFLRVMTHELRTPLNAVIGYAEIIQEDTDPASGSAQDAARIERSARHLLGLIEQIFQMTSTDAALGDVAETDMRATLAGCIQSVHDDAVRAGNRISLRIEASAERVLTNRENLSVCVNAILSNAVKFTVGGLIAVTAAREGSDVVVTVSDTGPGIAPRDLDGIFKPFIQVEAATTRAKGGLGLGLAVARRMAQALGGDVSVSSEMGRGSTFAIRFPALSVGARTADQGVLAA